MVFPRLRVPIIIKWSSCSAATLNKMTLIITILSITTLSIMTLSIILLNIKTLSIMTLSITTLMLIDVCAEFRMYYDIMLTTTQYYKTFNGRNLLM